MTSDDTQTYPQHAQTILKKHDFHFFWTICHHNISCLIITYHILWFHIISYDMIWYDMISYDTIWYHMIWYDMISYDMIWQDKIHFLDMFWTSSKNVWRVKNEGFPKSFGDLWAMFWHHPWCLRAGQKIKKLTKNQKIKCFSEAPESLENSYALIIKFIALFSHWFMHFFIFHIFLYFSIFSPL